MTNIIIPIAGKGSRFLKAGVKTPKPLIKINGKTILDFAIDSLNMPNSHFIFITRSFDNVQDNKTMSNIFSKINSFEEETFDINHRGAAHSCLLAEDMIRARGDLEKPLIITNCDQNLIWDTEKFLNFIKSESPDGAVILYKSDNPKNSFAKINNGVIIEIVEKTPISNDALVGLHYWKKASDFFASAKKLVNLKHNFLEESYVSETYNFLIKEGKTVLPYWLSDSERFIPLGTPEDINDYVGSSNWKKEN